MTPGDAQVPMLNLTDIIVSFCVTLLVTTSSLHLKVVEPWQKLPGAADVVGDEKKRPCSRVKIKPWVWAMGVDGCGFW